MKKKFETIIMEQYFGNKNGKKILIGTMTLFFDYEENKFLTTLDILEEGFDNEIKQYYEMFKNNCRNIINYELKEFKGGENGVDK
jgi:hypothetical protein